ncbi:MAG: hypothetical protein ACR2P4_00715 [Gammaproteobacteria bacterium]
MRKTRRRGGVRRKLRAAHNFSTAAIFGTVLYYHTSAAVRQKQQKNIIPAKTADDGAKVLL